MYVRHDARARETGARLVHACGFDSVPHDLGVYFTVGQLPEGVPLRVDGFVRSRRHVLRRHVRAPRSTSSPAAAQMLARGPGPAAPRAAPGGAAGRARRWARRGSPRRSAPGRCRCRRSTRRSSALGPGPGALRAGLPVPPLRGGAAAARGRSAGSRRSARAVRRGPAAARAALAVRTGIRPGEGPSAERRAKSWFTVRFVGEGGGRRVFTEVSGGDPGYDETAKMLAESALCLAFDDLPETSGQVTTAVAMGDALIGAAARGGDHVPGRGGPPRHASSAVPGRTARRPGDVRRARRDVRHPARSRTGAARRSGRSVTARPARRPGVLRRAAAGRRARCSARRLLQRPAAQRVRPAGGLRQAVVRGERAGCGRRRCRGPPGGRRRRRPA